MLCILSVLLLLVQPVCFLTGSFSAYGQTGVVNTDRLNLRSGPGTNYSAIKVLSTNTRVEILESTRAQDGYEWLKVKAGENTGYLRSDYVSLNVVYNSADTDFEAYLNSQGFPESYKNALRGLHQKYPNWIFEAQQTGIDWNKAVEEESRVGLNLVYTSNISSFKSTEEGAFDYSANYWPGFDGSVWVAASRSLIEHYMDPRNFLTDPYVFQFQKQGYDPSKQNRDGLEKMVNGTFLSGQSAGSGGDGYGPGVVNNSGQNSGTGPGSGSSSGTESGKTVGPAVEFVGPQASAAGAILNTLGVMTAYADWQKYENTWYYLNPDGTKNANGWFWIDGNKDGIAECYYFDQNGAMAASCTIDGYEVNSEGQWIQNGKVQTKNTGSTKTSGSQTSYGNSTYVDLIMKAAEQSGVSPYVLAAMIIQEQGTEGKSELISGKNSQYYGYYNFYNIAAYEHNGMSAVQAGLKYASESGNGNRPWNTVEKGIVGGAIAYGANYVDNGQDTFYLKKFNVQGSNKYKHQFMTNVIAAAQEGAKLSGAYSAEIKNSALVFRIPVYQNMPESACPMPTVDGNPNDRLKELHVDGLSLSPAFSIGNTEYEVNIGMGADRITVSGQTIDSHAKAEGFGTYSLNGDVTEIIVKVTAQNGSVRNYRITVRRSENGPVPYGSSGNVGGPGVVNNTMNMNTNSGNGSSDGTEIRVTNPTVTQDDLSSGTESNVVIGVGPM